MDIIRETLIHDIQPVLNLPQIPPPPTAAPVHTLNITATYTNWQLPQAFHELTANWIDQLQHQAHVLNQHNIPGKLYMRRVPGTDHDLLGVFGPTSHLLGKLCFADRMITFHNRFTAIPPKALLMGYTNKTDQNQAIGGHGEGFKIGANRLVAAGYLVEYRTRGEIWEFYHVEGELCVKRTHMAMTDTQRNDTRVRVFGNGHSVRNLWDSTRFLCTLDWYTIRNKTRVQHVWTLRSDDIEIDVLINPAFRGHIYANGVRVIVYRKDYTGPYGFNFRGNQMIPGRDRNTLHPDQFERAFDDVFNKLTNTVNPNRKKITDAFEMLSRGSLFHNLISAAREDEKPWIKLFVSHIRHLCWYPCSDNTEAEAGRRRLGLDTRVVSENHRLLLISEIQNRERGFLPMALERRRIFRELKECPDSTQITEIRVRAELAARVIAEIPVVTGFGCPQHVPHMIRFVRSEHDIPAVWDIVRNRKIVSVNLQAIEKMRRLGSLIQIVVKAMRWSQENRDDFSVEQRKKLRLRDIVAGRLQTDAEYNCIDLEDATAEIQSSSIPPKRSVPNNTSDNAPKRVHVEHGNGGNPPPVAVVCSGTCPQHCVQRHA